MATLEEVLTARLEADAVVAALCGDRIYPGRAPAGAALPHIFYMRAGGDRVRAMARDTGVHPARVQITVKAGTYAALVSLADAVKAALENWRDGVASPRILDCAYQGEFDGEDVARVGAVGDGTRRRNIDFQITYRSVET